MKKNILLLLINTIIISVILTSCFGDDTEIGTNKISEISIVAESNVINANVREELVFSPAVSQSIESTELKYEWSIGDYKEGIGYPVGDTLVLISEEPVLRNTFNKPGKYILRLKVTNEFGGKLMLYVLNVNTPYEEGLIVLSENESGIADISFLKTLTPEEIADGAQPEFLTNLFSTLNPEYQLNNAIDLDKIQNKLVVTTADNGKMYKMDHKTLDLIGVLTPSDDMPGIVPVALEGSATIDKNHILSADGSVYGYNPFMDIIFESNITMVVSGIDKTYSKDQYRFFIDYEESKVSSPHKTYYRGYIFESGDLFGDYDIVNLVCDAAGYVYVIATEKANPSNVRITKVKQYKFMYPEHYTYSDSGLTLTRESTVLVSKVTNDVYYTSGNDIYVWNYGPTVELPTTPIVSIEVGKEITCMELSPDEEYIYVGIYDPAATGMKGSIYIYNAGDMSLAEKHEGVADKPIKVFYKEK